MTPAARLRALADAVESGIATVSVSVAPQVQYRKHVWGGLWNPADAGRVEHAKEFIGEKWTVEVEVLGGLVPGEYPEYKMEEQ